MCFSLTLLGSDVYRAGSPTDMNPAVLSRFKHVGTRHKTCVLNRVLLMMKCSCLVRPLCDPNVKVEVKTKEAGPGVKVRAGNFSPCPGGISFK